MHFKPQKMTQYLEAGDYTGTIQGIEELEGKPYLVFHINVEGVLFNTTFFLSNPTLNNFAAEFTDHEGNFDETQVIGMEVCFTVEDKADSDPLKSKVTSLNKSAN